MWVLQGEQRTYLKMTLFAVTQTALSNFARGMCGEGCEGDMSLH